MKRLRYLLLFLVCLLFITSATVFANTQSVIYQTSTLGALQEGVFDGNITLSELKGHGDFGIGTFDGLEGEMVELNGKFYQIKADGHVYQPGAAMKSPFAAVTNFKTDQTAQIDKTMSYTELQAYIESLLPTKNIMYAVKIEGSFKYIKTRSVPKQAKPYPRLAEVVKNQPTFEFSNVNGTIIGYWLPNFLQGVNMAGYHLHFISDDHQTGGHLLECQITSGTLSLDYIYKIDLDLPAQSDFYKTDLSVNKQEELKKIEK